MRDILQEILELFQFISNTPNIEILLEEGKTLLFRVIENSR